VDQGIYRVSTASPTIHTTDTLKLWMNYGIFQLLSEVLCNSVILVYLPLKSFIMKNALKILAWVSGGVGIIMMLLGIIAVLNGDRFMGHFWSNYFYPAYNFLLLGIFLFVGVLVQKK
jgi:hypothetical protein